MSDTVTIGRALTERQRQVYRLLLASLLGRQRFPSYRELAQGLGLDPRSNKNAPFGHVKALKRHGLLAVSPGWGRIRLRGLALSPAFTSGSVGENARAAWEGSAATVPTYDSQFRQGGGIHSGSPLTVRQLEVYRTALSLLLSEQCPPTLRRLQEPLGIHSLNGVVAHVLTLERRGLLSHDDDGRIMFPGVRLEAVFEDSEAGTRARAAWED